MTMVAEPVTAAHHDEGAIRAFYDAYFEALDNDRLEEWPDFFVEDCLYRIIPRENFEAGLRQCIIQGDSRGMLIDRVQAIRSTQTYAPRYCRRFYSSLRLVDTSGGELHTRQNMLVIHTLIDQPSRILGCGLGRDRLVVNEDGQLKFVERTVVLDTEMIDNTIIYPF
jgi:3-phenylpropionate/cinnamic acid dioxygenase small subunit